MRTVLVWAVAFPLLVVTLVLAVMAWQRPDSQMWAAFVLPAAVLTIVAAGIARRFRPAR
jgi:bacteriorhodopsin